MTERYDSVTAKHYAAYRPPLHRLILERVIGSSESFASGLDFGCGTGYSAVALAKYSDHVCGVDLNQEMLSLAEPHPKITYTLGTVGSFGDFPDRPYDIVTFAGSLFYTKSEELRTALISACSVDGTVIIYDFNVLMSELMNYAGVATSFVPSEYDHNVGLADWSEFETVTNESDRITIAVSPQEATHVLLSDSSCHDVLQGNLGGEDLFDVLVSQFCQRKHPVKLTADIWCKRYRLAQHDRRHTTRRRS